MNKVAEVPSCAATGPVIEPAGHDPIVSRVDDLGAHPLHQQLLLLVLLLEVLNHFLDEVNRVIVAHCRLVVRSGAYLALSDNCKNLIALTCIDKEE